MKSAADPAAGLPLEAALRSDRKSHILCVFLFALGGERATRGFGSS